MALAAVLAAIFAALCPQAFADENEARIIAPEDDLPGATIDGYRIDFTPNGAIVVSRDGTGLFDGGLVYAMPGWKEWGTQIRKSGRQDRWELHPEDPTSLLSHGTLFDFSGKERFRFTQRTAVISGGVRLSYNITPLAKRELGTFGLVLRFPVLQTKGARAGFWPGFAEPVLPQNLKSASLYRGNARGAYVSIAGRPRVQAVAGKRLQWTLLDDRRWQMNTYRFIGSDRGLTTALSKGEKVDFTFDILLGDRACKDLPLGKGRLTIDPYGRIAVHASGKKLAEGGLEVQARPRGWLYETARPTATMLDGRGTSGACASGIANGLGTELAYDVQVAVENEQALLTFGVHKAKDETQKGGIRFALAIPASEVEALPTTTASKAAPAPDAPVSEKEPGEHRIVVAFQNGLALELEAETSWEIGKTKISGQECLLLSVPTSEVGENGQKAAVRVSVRLKSDTEATGT